MKKFLSTLVNGSLKYTKETTSIHGNQYLNKDISWKRKMHIKHQKENDYDEVLLNPLAAHPRSSLTPWLGIDPRRIKPDKVHLKDLQYRIRELEPRDIAQVMAIKRIQGTHDVASCLETWIKVDPKGIIIAETKSGNIACIFGMVHHHIGFYFGCLYYTLPEYRGLGIGQKVSCMGLDRIGKENTGLNAIPGKKDFFRICLNYPIVEKNMTCVIHETLTSVNPQALSGHLPTGVIIYPFNKSHLPFMYEFDLTRHGHQRNLFIELSCKDPDSHTLVAFKDGKCIGFGSIKKSCLNYYRLGPLYADDPQVAEALLKNLVISMPKESKGFTAMTFSNNAIANGLLDRIGCPGLNVYDRLYRKEKLNIDTEKVFAVFDINTTPY